MNEDLGEFVWHELMTTDLEAARGFYGQVLGWAFEPMGTPDQPYLIVSVAGTGIGGMMTMPPEACAQGARPGWVGYVGVDDVDAAGHRFAQGGGKLLKPAQDIPGVGRFAVVADPHGASLVLFRGRDGLARTPLPPGTPGTVGWNELHSGDQPKATPFYGAQFGWIPIQAMDMGPMGVYQIYGLPGRAVNGGTPKMLGGMMTKTPEMPTPPMWLYYFNVDDIDAALERAQSGGARILMGPHQVPGGNWVVQALDPQQAWFALVGPRRN